MGVESWFFKADNELKKACVEDALTLKYSPELNLKSREQVDEDHKKIQEGKDINSNYYYNVIEELTEFPDWCISEKNYWGIPIPYFVIKDTKDAFTTPEICRLASEVFAEHGADSWWQNEITDFLPEEMKGDAPNLERGNETFDCWFDSSLSWSRIKDYQMNPLEQAYRQQYGLIEQKKQQSGGRRIRKLSSKST